MVRLACCGGARIELGQVKLALLRAGWAAFLSCWLVVLWSMLHVACYF